MFKTKLVLEYLGKKKGIKQYKVLEPLQYKHFIVPIGFITDKASIPKWVKFLSPDFYYFLKRTTVKASILHDYLYSKGIDRKRSDELYREAMEQEKTHPIISTVFYYMVRLFGWRYYGTK